MALLLEIPLLGALILAKKKSMVRVAKALLCAFTSSLLKQCGNPYHTATVGTVA
jgi:hypothetical protein